MNKPHDPNGTNAIPTVPAGALDAGLTRTLDQPAAPPGTTDPVAADAGDASAHGLPTVPGYQVLREIARGGMGVVYQARQTALNRTVALKMILSAGHAGAADLERFRTESAAIAHLQHPHIVHIYEVGEQGGLPYFSLEFCNGGSLDRKLNGTPMLPIEAARLVETLARAMQVAHNKGIVHRDLSPGNVLFDGDGTAKIADFGLAKKLDEATRTASGAIMGTPSYMAPEQASGKSKEVGPASDVYALGAILYECLTGRPPFKAATALDTLLQVLAEEPVPPRSLNAQVPRDVEIICLKCLHKERGKRYPSAAEMAEDLGRFQRGEPILARPVGRVERTVKWAKRRPALAGLFGVTVLALVSLVLLAGNLVVARNDADEKRKDAEKQKVIAEEKENQAKKAQEFLVGIFRISEKDAQSGNKTAREILDQAEQDIPREFAMQPGLRDELLASIQDVKRGIDRTIPLAMILEVRGIVRLHSFDGSLKTVRRHDLLLGDERLTLGDEGLGPDWNGHVKVVILSDLHQEVLHSNREVTIGRQGCQPSAAVSTRSDELLMTFVPLPKGTFYMGWSAFGTTGQPSKKGTKTEIKEDFEIAVHAVTQGQWQAVMGNNPSWFSRKGMSKKSVLDISDEELKLFPVENISWDDAQEFVKKLNEREKKRGSVYVYRLPTEAEWEYACRGGATSEEECSYRFYLDKPTNELPSSAQANLSYWEENILTLGPGGHLGGKRDLGRTTRVGSYPANKLGLCEMQGNVWQWCANVYKPGGVLRGGSWAESIMWCEASLRREPGKNTQYQSGFRLARVRVR